MTLISTGKRRYYIISLGWSVLHIRFTIFVPVSGSQVNFHLFLSVIKKKWTFRAKFVFTTAHASNDQKFQCGLVKTKLKKKATTRQQQ